MRRLRTTEDTRLNYACYRLHRDTEFHVYSFLELHTFIDMIYVSKDNYGRVKRYLEQLKDLAWLGNPPASEDKSIKEQIAALVARNCRLVRSITIAYDPPRLASLIQKYSATLTRFTMFKQCAHDKYCDCDDRDGTWPLIGVPEVEALAQCTKLQKLHLNVLQSHYFNGPMRTLIRVCENNPDITELTCDHMGIDNGFILVDAINQLKNLECVHILPLYQGCSADWKYLYKTVQRLTIHVDWDSVELLSSRISNMEQLVELHLEYSRTFGRESKTLELKSSTLVRLTVQLRKRLIKTRVKCLNFSWKSLPNLQYAKFDHFEGALKLNLPELLQHSPHVQHLELLGKSTYNCASKWMFPQVAVHMKALQFLDLRTGSHVVCESELLHIAQAASRLQALKLDLRLHTCTQHCKHPPLVLSALRMLASTLRSCILCNKYAFPSSSTVTWSFEEAKLLEQATWPYLHTFSLEDVSDMQSILENMVGKCPTLQELTVISNRNDHDKDRGGGDALGSYDQAVNLSTICQLAQHSSLLHVEGNIVGECNTAMRYLQSLTYKDVMLQYGAPWTMSDFMSPCTTKCKLEGCDDTNHERQVRGFACRNCELLAVNCDCKAIYKPPVRELVEQRREQEELKLLQLLKNTPCLQYFCLTNTDFPNHVLANIQASLPSSITGLDMVEKYEDQQYISVKQCRPQECLSLIQTLPNLRTLKLPHAEIAHIDFQTEMRTLIRQHLSPDRRAGLVVESSNRDGIKIVCWNGKLPLEFE